MLFLRVGGSPKKTRSGLGIPSRVRETLCHCMVFYETCSGNNPPFYIISCEWLGYGVVLATVEEEVSKGRVVLPKPIGGVEELVSRSGVVLPDPI